MAKKYRPYFTAEELKEISISLKLSATPARLSIAQYIERFIIQIDHGVRQEAYEAKPKPTISEQLGFDTPSPLNEGLIAYKFFTENGRESCTPNVLKEALDYAYLNDLMSPEQEKEYEQEFL